MDLRINGEHIFSSIINQPFVAMHTVISMSLDVVSNPSTWAMIKQYEKLENLRIGHVETSSVKGISDTFLPNSIRSLEIDTIDPQAWIYIMSGSPLLVQTLVIHAITGYMIKPFIPPTYDKQQHPLVKHVTISTTTIPLTFAKVAKFFPKATLISINAGAIKIPVESLETKIQTGTEPFPISNWDDPVPLISVAGVHIPVIWETTTTFATQVCSECGNGDLVRIVSTPGSNRPTTFREAQKEAIDAIKDALPNLHVKDRQKECHAHYLDIVATDHIPLRDLCKILAPFILSELKRVRVIVPLRGDSTWSVLSTQFPEAISVIPILWIVTALRRYGSLVPIMNVMYIDQDGNHFTEDITAHDVFYQMLQNGIISSIDQDIIALRLGLFVHAFPPDQFLSIDKNKMVTVSNGTITWKAIVECITPHMAYATISGQYIDPMEINPSIILRFKNAVTLNKGLLDSIKPQVTSACTSSTSTTCAPFTWYQK
jgi:hypothetical protein